MVIADEEKRDHASPSDPPNDVSHGLEGVQKKLMEAVLYRRFIGPSPVDYSECLGEKLPLSKRAWL